jgi:hypothetical protein
VRRGGARGGEKEGYSGGARSGVAGGDGAQKNIMEDEEEGIGCRSDRHACDAGCMSM